MLNAGSPLNQDGIPMLYSIIFLSSPDSLSISIKAVTPLPNNRKKRLAALEIVTQSKEGRFIAGKNSVYYLPSPSN